MTDEELAQMWIDASADEGVIGHYREKEAVRALTKLIASVRHQAIEACAEACRTIAQEWADVRATSGEVSIALECRTAVLAVATPSESDERP